MTERACGDADIAVFCADVGSISQGNFSWAGPGGPEQGSTEIAELADAVATCLSAGQRVALGFEAPLFVPVPVEARMLGKARDGESKAWSAERGPRSWQRLWRRCLGYWSASGTVHPATPSPSSIGRPSRGRGRGSSSGRPSLLGRPRPEVTRAMLRLRSEPFGLHYPTLRRTRW